MYNPFEAIESRLATIESLLLDIKSPLPNQQQPAQADYLTREQARKRLGGISLPTLAEYTKNGVVKGKRIGRRVLYSPADIDAALTAIKTNGNAREVAA